MSNALHTDHHGSGEDADLAGRERARGFLATLLGEHPPAITWDARHPLQGHVHIGSHELVVIAPHDAAHVPVVLDASSWDAVQHSMPEERRRLLLVEAITDHDQLVSVVEHVTPAAA